MKRMNLWPAEDYSADSIRLCGTATQPMRFSMMQEHLTVIFHGRAASETVSHQVKAKSPALMEASSTVANSSFLSANSNSESNNPARLERYRGQRHE